MRSITSAIGLRYTIITSLYDRRISEDDKRCNMLNHLTYSKILAVDSYSNFIDCPSNIPNASIAIKILDDTMEPYLEKNSYAFLELNVPLSNKDVGLFKYNNDFLVRRFIIRKDKLVLRADNKSYLDIDLSEDSDFTIIGKVVAENK